MGVPPENSLFRQRDSFSQLEGPFNGGVLILALQPGRIDWHLTAKQAEEEPDSLGGLSLLKPEAIAKFQDLISRWMQLESYPPLIRLALGQVLLQPVETREAGYLQLRNYLPSVDLKPESTDFLYQINRPRQSTAVPSLRINRLCKWSVIRASKISFTLSAAQTEPTPLSRLVDSQQACRVELDINTVPEHQSKFDSATSISVFDELALLAKEIAEKGDVA
ncbi:MAG: hypothetical protein A4E20_13120 [Nitrospira sp. SG-bin2]|nr:MAG: hypothetical protein A4E20_13120 [Nitrospira sp. SG-bin2]